MPKVSGAPKELNSLLEKVYAGALKEYKGDKQKASQVAWAAAKKAGWKKDKNGDWKKASKPSEMSEITIDAFKAGEYPQGKFTMKELQEIESTYNPEFYEAPILIGHLSDPSYKGKSAIPAFGWIGKVKIVGDHLKLIASEFSEQLKGFIKEGFYKKVSAAFFEPNDPNNPTPGKWHLHHLAFLGGTPPAVKGLEQIAFAEVKGLSVEFAEMDTEIEESEPDVDAIEEMGVEDTIKDLSESCATFLSKIEESLKGDVDYETKKSRCSLAAMDLSNEISNTLGMQWMFQEKLENIEEHQKTEMSEKKSWLIELAEKLNLKRKETDMDKQKEQEYQQKIAEQEKKLKEFEEQAAQKAEADRVAQEAAAKTAKEDALKSEIAQFCDVKIKEGKMTPAMRGTQENPGDEKIMFDLGMTSPDALKAFQEKYSALVVPLGEINANLNIDDDKRPLIIKQAENYAKAHKNDVEFAELSAAEATNRALYLHSVNPKQYIFEDIKQTGGK